MECDIEAAGGRLIWPFRPVKKVFRYSIICRRKVLFLYVR